MMGLLRIGALCVLTGMVLMDPGQSAHAQGNNPHFELRASITSDEMVRLDWVPPTDVTFEYFRIYRAALDSNAQIHMDPGAFEQIDEVSGTVTSATDSPPIAEAHLFSYVVRGKTTTGPEIRSTVALVNFIGRTGTDDFVKIHTMPPDRAKTGAEYRYQVGASSSNPSATLTYQLQQGPEGMTITNAGLVRWIPSPGQLGWFQAAIRVTSDKGGKQEQRWQIGVGSGSGVVQGYVKEAGSGNPIQWVMVKLYQRNLDHHYEYRAITDVHGFYRVEAVDPATYFVRAVPLRPEYIGQWFDGVKHVWEATPVTVPDVTDPNGGITTVNFNLLPVATDRPHYSVSGIITDDGGTPIAGAWVDFARPEFVLNASREYGNGYLDGGYDRDCFDGNNFGYGWHHDLRFGEESRWVFRATSNASGEYTIRLPLGFYVALARAPGYSPVFYDGQPDLLSADILEVNADLEGIDFALPQLPPVPLGGMSGVVTEAETGDPVMARMIAFRDRWTETDETGYPATFYTDTDEAGHYAFSDLPPGTYYVLALPLGHYTPSFYSTTGPTIRWKEATPIVVDGNTVSGIDISVTPMVRWAFGYTWMHGYVYANTYANGTSAPPGKYPGAVSGALVYAIGESGRIAGYGITGPDGSYKIDALAPGTYTATAIRAGFLEATSAPVSPTYDAEFRPVPVEATLDLTVTAVGEGGLSVPEQFLLGQNYPNPFNPSTVIRFELPSSSRVSLVVYTVLGQEVARLVDQTLPGGTHEVTWDGSDASGREMTSGVYLYRITAGGFTAAQKMVLVK